MDILPENHSEVAGLTDEEVLRNRAHFGSNSFEDGEKSEIWIVIKSIVLEPMFILLAATCTIYLITGNIQDAVILMIGLSIIAGISLFQEKRSRSAVNALRKLAAPKVSVLRNGNMIEIDARDVVQGDVMNVVEGDIIAADGEIYSSNDLSVNEAILTGESFPVIKSAGEDSRIYYGTMVVSGTGMVKVTAVGRNTRFGHIKNLIQEGYAAKSPLQLQIASFVKSMVIVGLIAFCVVVLYNYLLSGKLIEAMLTGLTLAMSILPEEIPVAVTTFMALGAYRLIRYQIIVKRPQLVEALGSTTVLCVDKTGTLTRNLMEIAVIYDAHEDNVVHVNAIEGKHLPLVESAMWASEQNPFDPMEIAIHQLYGRLAEADKRRFYQQIHEYPIGGQPPLMTHIHSGPGQDIIIAAKGAPEAIITQSDLPPERKAVLMKKATELAAKGLRVLGVGTSAAKGPWPKTQQEFTFQFLGLIAFHDPPIENAAQIIQTFLRAGISVKMMTGDYAETALAVATQIGLKNSTQILTGTQVMELDKNALAKKVGDINVFARMSPEAKVKVINTLINNGEVVAMTGDGVNDAPALKIAHVGISMGRRGSEVAKNAAALIIGDDNLQHMTEAIAIGRKIYDNIRKGVRYIVSIHIPIILVVMLPLILHWKYPIIFTPVHVVFLELIMGPTCSIVFENEPMEPGTMTRPPRLLTNTFLSFRQLIISIVQGLVITVGCLGIGFWYIRSGSTEETTRSMIFVTLLLSNIFLSIANRSFTLPLTTTIRYKNPLMMGIIILTMCMIPLLLYVPALRQLFLLGPLSATDVISAIVVAAIASLWMEPAKYSFAHDKNHAYE